jgi:copper homeostasis protein CutC
MMQQLLPAFRELGLQTHRAFDELADRIKAGGRASRAPWRQVLPTEQTVS